MRIKYLELENKNKVFCFEENQYCDKNGDKYYYNISNTTPHISLMEGVKGMTKEGEVEDMIEDIREQFTYKMYRTDEDEDYDKILLKDLSDVQLCDILSYNNSDTPVSLTQEIFIQEIKYRTIRRKKHICII